MSRGRRPRRAHPRSRGENAVLWVAMRADGGSSPLTRGKRLERATHPGGHGLIPAHAGKTGMPASSPRGRAAHPRSRGENAGGQTDSGSSLGSSPLTRGKQQEGLIRLEGGRLIPAHAGKTRGRGELHQGPGAHPRSRGENLLIAHLLLLLRGSSPLTRGKRVVVDRHIAGEGLIPAHAGKTRNSRRRVSKARAHPRSRGENLTDGYSSVWETGSSPLTRGKRDRRLPGRVDAGLIPAHAGKTRTHRRTHSRLTAHPRSRGENKTSARKGTLDHGSSPLTRGKRGTRSAPGWRGRLIPAHAGKTANSTVCCPTWEAHPRSRGENGVQKVEDGSDEGSSPLTRGKLLRGLDRGQRARLIPAHAGKTAGAA